MEQFGDVVDDSVVVGQRRSQDTDERVILFLKMREGKPCAEEFKQRIRSAIRSALSARHVPSYIFEVPEIPVRRLIPVLLVTLTIHLVYGQ
jgi:acetoacetyl-CoA synthetase